MTETLTDKYLVRTRDEIRERNQFIATHLDDGHYTHRWSVLQEAMKNDSAVDVRTAARLLCQDTINAAEPNVGPALAMLDEYAWLMGRDDVVSEMVLAADHRGNGWPEVWAFATHLDRYTTTCWAEGVARTPEIAQWAAGLPVPTGEEPF